MITTGGVAAVITTVALGTWLCVSGIAPGLNWLLIFAWMFAMVGTAWCGWTVLNADPLSRRGAILSLLIWFLSVVSVWLWIGFLASGAR